jgi:hypothetical protein
MSTDRRNEHDVDKLLKQVLKDDLPPEAELSMKKCLDAFRHRMESFDDTHEESRRAWWRLPSMSAQWPPGRGLFRKEALACLSAVMLAAGVVIHLGGYQSLLANTISLLKMSVSLTEQLRLARSMDCVISMPALGSLAPVYRIRWIRDGHTRMDVESPHGLERTLWIFQGSVTVFSYESGRSSTTPPAPDLQEPLPALVSPNDLARRLSETWQLQPEKKRHHGSSLVFIDRRDGAVIEVYFDRNSYLPISLDIKPPKANGKGGPGGVATTAVFIWNQPIEPELLVPSLKSGR